MPTIHGAALSPFVRKVRAFMTLKGLPYDLEYVFPGSTDPAFRKMSPLGKIPAFSDGDFAFSDSSVICAYLEKKHPEPPLYPADLQQYARALWLEEYADSILGASVGPKIFFQRVVNQKMRKQEIDEAAVQAAIDGDLPGPFDYLESQLGDGNTLVGGAVTIADLAVATHFVNLKHAGERVDASRWPKLARFVEFHHGEPYFKPFIEQEAALIPADPA